MVWQQAVAFALVVVAVAAAPATGQSADALRPELTIRSMTPANETLRSGLDLTMLVVEWEYSAPLPGANVLFQDQSALLTWTFDANACTAPGVQLAGLFEERIEFPVGWTGTTTGSSSFQLGLTTEAPGETTITCDFTGQVGEVNAAMAASAPETHTFGVTGAYRPQLDVRVADAIVEGTPGASLSISIQVRNLGNSESSVVLSLVGEPPADWRIAVPSQIVLESASKGGRTLNGTLVVQVTPPDEDLSEEVLSFTVKASSIKDPTKASQPYQVQVLVRARDGPPVVGGGDSIHPAPGVGPLLAFGLVALAALARRRAA